ncbi:MAG: hypothetical protein AVDCRST_MAG56-3249, partial [uncultured Cytophagales bacterium]
AAPPSQRRWPPWFPPVPAPVAAAPVPERLRAPYCGAAPPVPADLPRFPYYTSYL